MLLLEVQLSGRLCLKKKIINIFPIIPCFNIRPSKCDPKCLADNNLHEDVSVDVSAFLAKYFVEVLKKTKNKQQQIFENS